MRRLSLMTGAICAAIVVSAIADVQQAAAQQPPTRQAATQSQGDKPAPSPTWTLFVVTVLYKTSWTVTPVAAFTGDSAKTDCENAVDQLNKIRGLSESNARAFNTKGDTQSAICLQATAAQQSRSGGDASKP